MILRGHVGVWVLDGERWTLARENHNDIMVVAKTQAADLIREHPLSSPIRAMAVGSSATAVNTSQTQLVAEVTRKAIPTAGTNTATQINTRSGSEITIRQVFGPGLVFTLREVGLFADIIELTDPSSAPGLVSSASGGTLTTATYTVGYTYVNNNGETILSPTAAIAVTGPTGKIDVTVPALPSRATATRVYAAPSGTPLLSGSTTTTAYAITSFPAGVTPPVSNTSLIPGLPNTGAMINRAVISDLSVLVGTTFFAETKLIFS